jgi:uroporphyrin-III C-methyltransferase
MKRGAREERGSGLVVLGGGAARPRPLGRVALVGAGPGAADLLTLRAARLLAAADVVVHDRLVSDAVLSLAPPTARRIYVGKRKSSHSVPQAGIDALLVALAREGLAVVRLKGGDPFVFGRGGEELLACRAAGVPCEVVPGVSAAFAAAASGGAPLTHRGLARTVTLATGHAAPGLAGAPDLDWEALARPGSTAVIYMGVSTAGLIAERLIAAGRAPDTPAIVVENASLPGERIIPTRLADLAQAAQELAGPAVLIIGAAAALALVTAAPEARDAAACA